MGRFVSRASRSRIAGKMPATRGRFVSRASRSRIAGKMPATQGRFVSRASRSRIAGKMPATRGRFVSRASRPRTPGKMPATRGRFSRPCGYRYSMGKQVAHPTYQRFHSCDNRPALHKPCQSHSIFEQRFAKAAQSISPHGAGIFRQVRASHREPSE
jgi:hypothetical protein